LAPGLQTHGQRVAHRNSTHSFALDKTFRFIDGMTNRRGFLLGECPCRRTVLAAEERLRKETER
jgi:hypothetical protein